MIGDRKRTHFAGPALLWAIPFAAMLVVSGCNQVEPASAPRSAAANASQVSPNSAPPHAAASSSATPRPSYGGGPTASGQGTAPMGRGHAGMGHGHGMHGPAGMTDVQVTPVDIANGIALTFTTTPDHVAALQKRVESMAERHNARAGSPGQAQNQPAPGCPSLAPPPPSTASVTPLSNGARIDITANSSSDAEAIRKHFRTRWQSAQSGQCPMMP